VFHKREKTHGSFGVQWCMIGMDTTSTYPHRTGWDFQNLNFKGFKNETYIFGYPIYEFDNNLLSKKFLISFLCYRAKNTKIAKVNNPKRDKFFRAQNFRENLTRGSPTFQRSKIFIFLEIGLKVLTNLNKPKKSIFKISQNYEEKN
jgi:hypothetical protein